MNWTYSAIMLGAVATGGLLYRLQGRPLGLSWRELLGVGLGAFCGGMIGAKLPFVLADWPGLVSGTAWIDDGKTIMAGLVGGYFGVQIAEWALDVRGKSCDALAVPLAAAVAVGRLACFQAGCCHGTVTSLPWGVDFGDGLYRHPTQLYESAFHLTAAVVLYQLGRRRMFEGQLVRLYFVAYFVYRFLTEFIRPEQTLWLGLTAYQWAALGLMPLFALWCCPGCRPLGWWPRFRRIRPREVDLGDGPLQETRTVCPTCLEPVLGTTFQQGGKVYLRRDCPEHGESVALVSSDRRHYYLRDEVPHPPLDEGCCRSPEPGHKTCLALLEITGACNLRCPVCFARSPRGGHRAPDELVADLERFLESRGRLDVLQLSGGEPLLHPDLLEIVDRCKTLPIDYLMINTNGLTLAEDGALAAELARRTPGLELFLQMDGLDAGTYGALRGEDLLARKQAVIEKIIEHDLPTTLVVTVVRGVNEDQVGALLRLGLQTPQVRGVTYQPAAWSGRFAAEADPLDRVTLADVVELLVDQSGGMFGHEDFQPLPCSNPNCCSLTFTARRRRGTAVPLTRIADVDEHLDILSDRVKFTLSDARQCCSPGRRPEGFFRVAIKPFMDAWTYDQDRVDECCVHVIQPGGGAVSFCQFNTLIRGVAAEREAGTAEESHDAQPV